MNCVAKDGDVEQSRSRTQPQPQRESASGRGTGTVTFPGWTAQDAAQSPSPTSITAGPIAHRRSLARAPSSCCSLSADDAQGAALSGTTVGPRWAAITSDLDVILTALIPWNAPDLVVAWPDPPPGLRQAHPPPASNAISICKLCV
jgi:hypothetical protein